MFVWTLARHLEVVDLISMKGWSATFDLKEAIDGNVIPDEASRRRKNFETCLSLDA